MIFYRFCEYNFLKKMIIRNAVIHTTSLRSILIISVSSINVRHLRCLDFVSTTFRPWKCQICLEKNVIHRHRPRRGQICIEYPACRRLQPAPLLSYGSCLSPIFCATIVLGISITTKSRNNMYRNPFIRCKDMKIMNRKIFIAMYM